MGTRRPQNRGKREIQNELERKQERIIKTNPAKSFGPQKYHRGRRYKKDHAVARKVGYVLLGIQTIATIAFIIALLMLNMLPVKFFAIILVLLLGILFALFFLYFELQHYNHIYNNCLVFQHLAILFYLFL